jgi:predicted nucleic-acid-binding protein
VLTVDSTVVVRLIVNDSPRETKRAAALFSAKRIHLPTTVLLETECVLRYAYKLDAETIARSLRRLLGLPTVTVDDPRHIESALRLYEQGLDFTDALHLAATNGATDLKTLDPRLVERARSAGIRGVTLL